MRLGNRQHLAYCTNIHPAESWEETFHALNTHTLAVKRAVCPDGDFAIGLRLSDRASRELSDPVVLRDFRQWLKRERCYVFAINGFPFGRFHGTRVKERVFQPDWRSAERLDYTKRLFDLLVQLDPPDGEASVSTLPGSFKAFIETGADEVRICENLWRCVEHVAELSRQTGLDLHLGVEPEPLGWFENSAETLGFFERMETMRPGDERLHRHLGVNYDTCHFAIQYEEPREAFTAFRKSGVRISKVHLSSAIRAIPDGETRAALAKFSEQTYLHQVVARRASGELDRYRDLDEALAAFEEHGEWRVHFHIPLHCPAYGWLQPTSDHVEGTLDFLSENPAMCRHLEMETYTWEVLPEGLKSATVEEQLEREYAWCLGAFDARGMRS